MTVPFTTGVLVTTSELNGLERPIASTTLGGSSASIDISSLSTAYATLVIEAYLRADPAQVGNSVYLRFNNDSGSNYDCCGYAATDNSGTYSHEANATGPTLSSINIGLFPQANAPANSFGAVRIVIPHYAGTSNHKSLTYLYYTKTANASDGNRIGNGGGTWRNTSAINRVTLLLPGGGNFITDCQVIIYGKGS